VIDKDRAATYYPGRPSSSMSPQVSAMRTGHCEVKSANPKRVVRNMVAGLKE